VKRVKRWMMLAVVLLLVVSVGSAAAQEPGVISPILEAQMAELDAWTEAARNLTPDNEVPHDFPTRDELRAYIEATYREELTPELAARSLAFYNAVGMLPPGVDLTQLFIDVLGSQVAGFYDPDTGVMNVIPMVGDGPGENLSLTEQIIYVHEYVHALQDANFDLDNHVGTDELMDHPDRALASLSLVEGDASAVMNLYTQRAAEANPLAALSLLTEGLAAGNLLPPGDIPAPLMRELMFPYETGLNFALSIYQSTDSWDAVDAAFANPPTTSEQIIHPEKYLAGEEGALVEFVTMDEFMLDTWTQQWDTAMGEFYLGEHLRQYLPRAEALEAAAGWGGDRFQVYTNADGEVAWTLKLVVDSRNDSREFVSAYDTWMQAYAEANDGQMTFGEEYACVVAEQTICIGEDEEGHIITSAPIPELAHTQMDVQIRPAG
jgi:hypothetical protein